MKELRRSLAFGLLALSAFQVSACAITVGDDTGGTSDSDDGGAQPETGTPEAGSAGDDTGTSTEATATDDATKEAATTDDAASDGGTCSLAVDTGSATCDACVEGSCCDAIVACDSEPTDAGTTECEDVDSCYVDCLVPPADSGVDGGTPEECVSLCSTSHSAGSVADFAGLLACVSTACSSPCE